MSGRTAAIIGGGVIGGGWAARFLLSGWDVRVFDPAPDAARKLNAVLENARYAYPMLYDRALPPEGRLTQHDTLADALAGVEWIQESIPERLNLKQTVLAQIEAHAPADAIIGSSTSGFKPTDLQTGMAHPGRLIVAHPFNPVYLLPLVEVAGGAQTASEYLERAGDTLRDIGMHPLQLRKEIDAHIADRLLEAVWRESLWLVRDGVATTAEIDDAIRYGFGLRWAQMGLFETYRIAGGEDGMAHFIAQFGPALEWPWTKLVDVPELTDDLIATIAAQSDAQSGHIGIRELERLRDDNLVAILRALKARDAAAGTLLRAVETDLPETAPDPSGLIRTVARCVPSDWTDYNGHMNESRYGQVFSDAADDLMVRIGADASYVAAGMSYFTVETTIKYLLETHAGAPFHVLTRVTEGKGKKLRLFHSMYHDNGTLLATCDQLLLHVSLETRRTCEPAQSVRTALEALAAAHSMS